MNKPKIGEFVKALVGRNRGTWGWVSNIKEDPEAPDEEYFALLVFSGQILMEGEYYDDEYWVHSSNIERSNNEKVKKRLKIEYCSHCKVWQASCPECGMGGCSGGHRDGCESVDDEIRVFNALELLLGKTDLAKLLEMSLNYQNQHARPE